MRSDPHYDSDITKEVRALLIEAIKRKIAVRAYELYQERQSAPGGALDDWLKAEEEILGQSLSMPLFRP